MLYPTSLAGPVSVGASSPAVESTLGGVPAPFARDLLRFGLSLWSCLASFHSSWEFQSSSETLVVTHFGRGVGRYNYCEQGCVFPPPESNFFRETAFFSFSKKKNYFLSFEGKKASFWGGTKKISSPGSPCTT